MWKKGKDTKAPEILRLESIWRIVADLRTSKRHILVVAKTKNQPHLYPQDPQGFMT